MQRGRYELFLDYVGKHIGLTSSDRALDAIFPGDATLSLLRRGDDVQGADLDPGPFYQMSEVLEPVR